MTHGSAVSIMQHQPDDPRNCNYASPSPPKPVRIFFIPSLSIYLPFPSKYACINFADSFQIEETGSKNEF